MSRFLNRTLFSLRGRQFCYLDAAAALLFLVSALYYVLLDFRSVGPSDEGMYLTVPYRMMIGERLIVDEWHVSMFSGIFQLLPMKAFIAITGDTEGIVLYFRLLYTACKLICFIYLYANYRRYGAAALIGIATYMSFDAFGCYTLNYYTMSILGMVFVTTELTSMKEKSSERLIFVGIVIACVVLIQPIAAVLYFIYTALVTIRLLAHRRNRDLFSFYGFVINGRIWRWLTVGIILSAGVFMLVFVVPNWNEVTLAFPELFTDAEYDLLDLRRFVIDKLYAYLYLLGIYAALPIVSVDVVLCAVLWMRQKKGSGKQNGEFWFAVSVALFVGSSAIYLRIAIFFKMASLLGSYVLYCLTSLGWKCFFLIHERNRRLYFVFLSGLLFSFFTDFASHATLWAGLAVSTLVVPVFIKDTAREIVSENVGVSLPAVAEKHKTLSDDHVVQQRSNRFRKRMKQSAQQITTRKKTLFRASFAALAVSYIAMFGCFLYSRAAQPLLEYVYLGESIRQDIVIQEGPMKGISTCQKVKDCYDAAIADLDFIKAKTNGPVYVGNCCCWYYLYLDLPYSAYSAWFSLPNNQRQLRWWELHPDKLPEYIYLPYFDCDHYSRDDEKIQAELDFLSDCFAFEQKEGKAGYILRVTDVRFN